MNRPRSSLVAGLAAGMVWLTTTAAGAALTVPAPSGWAQWGHDPQHRNVSGATGQPLDGALADLVVDPFVAQEKADFGGELLAHYQVPLTRGDDVWIEAKSGIYTPLAPDFSNFATHWNSQVWNERRLSVEDGRLVQRWDFASDWKPVPQPIAFWEPVFQAALVGDSVYVPGFGGSVFRLDARSGQVRARIDPFDGALDPNTFVAGPISADARGDVYYNALRLNSRLTTADSWLVQVDARGRARKVSYADLVPGAPASCLATFTDDQLPWPPSPDAVPGSVACGPQRPGVNVAPAIAPDGTIYTVSRADFDPFYSYLVAVQPDLRPKWTASLRDRLDDGCGVLLPIAPDDTPQRNACRHGARTGVDPITNQRPAGVVFDNSTASPTVMPDGSVLYGALTFFNGTRGSLLEFDARGRFRAAYDDFGWDTTPAVFVDRDGREHVVLKDNHYGAAYCSPDPSVPVSQVICASVPPGPDFIVQLDASLVPEWEFRNTTVDAGHPNGFEWCVNAPAIDAGGTVYANSEDGRLYAIGQGHRGVFTTPRGSLFLSSALGAAYTPLSLTPDGRVLTQNDGHLFAVGSADLSG
jgi:outer membrane protein assembly factor BamB